MNTILHTIIQTLMFGLLLIIGTAVLINTLLPTPQINYSYDNYEKKSAEEKEEYKKLKDKYDEDWNENAKKRCYLLFAIILLMQVSTFFVAQDALILGIKSAIIVNSLLLFIYSIFASLQLLVLLVVTGLFFGQLYQMNQK